MATARTSAAGPQQPTLRRDALANQERLLAAAVAAVLREGPQVPMATVAAEAGVGIATLYRRYPNRGALLEALTQRAFRLVLECASRAAACDETAIASLSSFLDCVIGHRNQLVLPLHGGPTTLSPDTLAVRADVHRVIQRMLDRGHDDGSIRPDATTGDIVILGAMLAQPLPNAPDWDRTSQRQKAIFLDGLATRRPT